MNEAAASTDTWSLAQPNARRSLFLCAAGALIGLGIAGLGLFTAQGTRTSRVPAEDVALVNQVPILMSDYIQQLRSLYDVSLSEATPAQKKQALHDMIREELYVQRGVELGLQSDTVEVRTALVGAVEALSAADATMAQPSEGELRLWYRTHGDEFADEGAIDAADYLLPRDALPARIAAASAALKAAGADTVAADRAAPPSKARTEGADFYFAARIHLGDRLFEAARLLSDGQVSAPVVLPDGVHLVLVRRNRRPVTPPFDSVRDRVLSGYVAAQAKQLTAANERFLDKRADIQLAKGFE